MRLMEFDIIEKYFTFNINDADPYLKLGIGDDAAIVEVPTNFELALCIDTLVAGMHFPIDTHPFDIAYKAIAVNLSDLAAMGAEPKWITLALTLPEADATWLQNFSAGCKHICQEYKLQLIGGDLTQGPLTISIQAHGFVPKHQALTRKGAKEGDKIYVTGQLGDAGLGLQVLQNKVAIPQLDLDRLLVALNRPKPCIVQGQILRTVASSCIDISDGLVADLGHILQQSHVGAKVYVEKIPLSPLLKQHLGYTHAISMAISAGDDYQLCFTIAPENEKILASLAHYFPLGLTHIGEITEEQDLRLINETTKQSKFITQGYEHFRFIPQT